MHRYLTWLIGIGFLGLGLLFSLNLQTLGGQLGTKYGRDGLIDALAVYVGLHPAFGTFFVICTLRRQYANLTLSRGAWCFWENVLASAVLSITTLRSFSLSAK